jgi:hypothetical protein
VDVDEVVFVAVPGGGAAATADDDGSNDDDAAGAADGGDSAGAGGSAGFYEAAFGGPKSTVKSQYYDEVSAAVIEQHESEYDYACEHEDDCQTCAMSSTDIWNHVTIPTVVQY